MVQHNYLPSPPYRPWVQSLGRYNQYFPFNNRYALTDSQQALLLPPLFALTLYVLTTYIILPYYRHFRARSSYSLLPSAQSPSNDPSLAARLFSRIQTFVGGSKRRASSSSLLGDEELEEGFANLTEDVSRGRNDVVGGLETESDRRLSRDLEIGFRDSSDEEGDDRRQGR